LLLLLALLAVPAASQASKTHKPAAKKSASTFQVGIQDAAPQMFQSPLFKQLRTRITRYIAPYDAAVSKQDFYNARAYILNAQAQGIQVLVAFYHSRRGRSALKNPSVATYTKDVKLFVKDFPQIKYYQPWDEANRGNIRGLLASPSASQAAAYYVALRKVLAKCRGCINVGLDVLDAQSIRPTLTYISQFKSAVRRLRAPLPSTWGLHNYSDTNRFSSSRTRAVLAAVPGNVWLTETGGIVNFPPSFPNKNGSGVSRASKALSFMFRLAKSNPRIKRLYIFNWSAGNPNERFDAGLLDKSGKPRSGYLVVCSYFRAKTCTSARLKKAGYPVDTKR
jgi:hypothetical protein